MSRDAAHDGRQGPGLRATRCPGCLGVVVRPLRRVGGFLLARCPRCDLVFVLPRPSERQLAAYYAECFRKASAGEAIMRGNRLPVHASGLSRIQRLAPGGRLVDVGAAYGDFLELAHAHDYEVFGVEVASGPCNRIAARGFPHYCGSLTDAPVASGSIDVITFWDTLEHLADLHETLLAARRMLRHEGLLAATVPNRRFQETLIGAERLLGRDSNHRLEVPAHLNHFSARALSRALGAAGFRVVSVQPAPPTPVARPGANRAKRVVYAAAQTAEALAGINVGNSLFVMATTADH